MKLFIATNEYTYNTDNIKLLNVAIKSALENTPFDVHIIFDGDINLLSYLSNRVKIIKHKHRCFDIFNNSKRHKDITISSGTFLRTEIPFICKKIGYNDKYVFYTDYDVLFLKDSYNEILSLTPTYFAAAPESNMHDWSYINAGVMLINVNHFYEKDEHLLKEIYENFDTYDVYDQSMYNKLYKNTFNKLPLEYNWKTYWGINESAKIIHFHGAKPLMIESEWRANLPIIKNLREKDIKSFKYYEKIWESYL